MNELDKLLHRKVRHNIVTKHAPEDIDFPWHVEIWNSDGGPRSLRSILCWCKSRKDAQRSAKQAVAYRVSELKAAIRQLKSYGLKVFLK